MGATLDVHVLGVEWGHGQILVALCAKGEALDSDCRHGARTPAQRGSVSLRLDGVPPGTYALLALHDLDGDRKLKRGRFGKPAEPIGLGNDAEPRFGPPSFEAAAIRLNGDRMEVSVRLRHP